MAAAPLPSTANAVQTVVLWPTQPSEQRLPIPDVSTMAAPRPAGPRRPRCICQCSVAGRPGILRSGGGRPWHPRTVTSMGTGGRRRLRDPALEDQVSTPNQY